MTKDEAITWLRKQVQHYDCEDPWYSCAKLTIDDHRRSDKCDCGADEENETREQIARLLEPVGRVLFDPDSWCPSCGHNRDRSSVSSIDHQDGTRSCQMCGIGWLEI